MLCGHCAQSTLERVLRQQRSQFLGTCFAAAALKVPWDVFCSHSAHHFWERVLRPLRSKYLGTCFVATALFCSGKIEHKLELVYGKQTKTMSYYHSLTNIFLLIQKILYVYLQYYLCVGNVVIYDNVQYSVVMELNCETNLSNK